MMYYADGRTLAVQFNWDFQYVFLYSHHGCTVCVNMICNISIH